MATSILNLEGFGRISKRVFTSCVLDWIILIIIGLITYGLNQINPVYHPFSLVDLSISYPYKDELVSTTHLTLASIAGPAIIIFLVSILAVPGPYASRRVPHGMLIRRKLWEWYTGWLGLALSVMMALLITTGLKNVFGKPRPNMLSRCLPDTSPQAIRDHTVGSYAVGFSEDWVLVDYRICTQKDRAALNDGFRSFPSGHSSTSWSGLLYLSLFLCSKFAFVFPRLPDGHDTRRSRHSHPQQTYEQLPHDHASLDARRPILNGRHEDSLVPFNARRNEAAAPPLHLLFLLIIPIGTALFICASRFYDYRHHGFDILSGSLIGILTSWFAFRMYHMPVSSGLGWAWGPRSAGRAFGVGVGSIGYVSAEDMPYREAQDDLELGMMQNRSARHAESPFGDSLQRTHTPGTQLTASDAEATTPATLDVPRGMVQSDALRSAKGIERASFEP